MSKTLDLAKELISLKSVTPNDAGCQEIVAKRLKQFGFNIENLNFGDVKNLWAILGVLVLYSHFLVTQMLFLLDPLISGIVTLFAQLRRMNFSLVEAQQI